MVLGEEIAPPVALHGVVEHDPRDLLRLGVASFKATLEIEVLDTGWQRVPLAFSKVAFEEVIVDGTAGVLSPAGQGYELLLRGVGRHKVEARFVAGIARGKEFATCSFDLPAVPLHKLSFRVPGKGTEIKLEPARAMTTTNEGEETVLLVFLGPQPSAKDPRGAAASLRAILGPTIG